MTVPQCRRQRETSREQSQTTNNKTTPTTYTHSRHSRLRPDKLLALLCFYNAIPYLHMLGMLECKPTKALGKAVTTFPRLWIFFNICNIFESQRKRVYPSTYRPRPCVFFLNIVYYRLCLSKTLDNFDLIHYFSPRKWYQDQSGKVAEKLEKKLDLTNEKNQENKRFIYVYIFGEIIIWKFWKISSL